MSYESPCSIRHNICSVGNISEQVNNSTIVQVIVDEFGNLEIIDPDNDLGAIYSENEGNFSGTGTKANNFRTDLFGNFEFTP